MSNVRDTKDNRRLPSVIRRGRRITERSKKYLSRIPDGNPKGQNDHNLGNDSEGSRKGREHTRGPRHGCNNGLVV